MPVTRFALAYTYFAQVAAAVLMVVAAVLMGLAGQTDNQFLGYANFGLFLINAVIFAAMFTVRSKLPK